MKNDRANQGVEFLLLSFALLLSSCSHKPPGLLEGAPRDTSYTRQDESFDPLSLDEEDLLKLPESKLKPYSGSSPGSKSSDKVSSGSGYREAAGFRVQLIATDAEAEARALEQQALLDFQEKIYMIFDPPNYKIRVGDCQTRPEANALKEQAIKLGYGNAWVVQSRVRLADH